MCDGCGQVWASGSFLDPTVKAECGYCGGRLAHRRRLPSGVALDLGQLRTPVAEPVSEPLPLAERTPVG